jgi:hypothetical protein
MAGRLSCYNPPERRLEIFESSVRTGLSSRNRILKRDFGLSRIGKGKDGIACLANNIPFKVCEFSRVADGVVDDAAVRVIVAQARSLRARHPPLC